MKQPVDFAIEVLTKPRKGAYEFEYQTDVVDVNIIIEDEHGRNLLVGVVITTTWDISDTTFDHEHGREYQHAPELRTTEVGFWLRKEDGMEWFLNSSINEIKRIGLLDVLCDGEKYGQERINEVLS